MANEEGGINGRKISLFTEDGKYDLDYGMKVFEALYKLHHPVAVWARDTKHALEMVKIAKDRKILLTGASFSSTLAQQLYPCVFVAGPTYSDQLEAILRWIARENIDKKPTRAKVAFFRSDSPFGKDPIRWGYKTAKRLRIEVVTEQITGFNPDDVSKEVEALHKADPDYVIFHGYAVGPVPKVIRQCRDLGMTKTVFVGTYYGTTKLLLDALDADSAENYYGVCPYSFWWQDEVPGIQKLKAYNKKHYPDKEYRTIHYIQAAVTGKIIVDVLKKAESAGKLNDPDYLGKALNSVKDLDTDGLADPKLSCSYNRFPSCRIWKAYPNKGIFLPISDWLRRGSGI
jgi:branched-chain amino acid transport system substrate-binding protein